MHEGRKGTFKQSTHNSTRVPAKIGTGGGNPIAVGMKKCGWWRATMCLLLLAEPLALLCPWALSTQQLA